MLIFDIFTKIEHKRENATSSNAPIEWLIVGLGNPGTQYAMTRHNAGFRALDAYCESTHESIKRLKFKALVMESTIHGKRVLLMKPQTYMNLSGEAVQEAANFYQIPPARVLVLVDDISLDVGRIRVRAKGSAGGQNGLKSIISHLHTDMFPRIKIGVGDKPHPDYSLADWVLSRLTESEEQLFAPALTRAMDAAKEVIQNGTAAAAQKYNGQA